MNSVLWDGRIAQGALACTEALGYAKKGALYSRAGGVAARTPK
jgi:hypothetical protein